MASFPYNKAKLKLGNKELEFDADDLRAILVMSNTTADTDDDAEFIDDIGTLDELDGSGYARVVVADAVDPIGSWELDSGNDRGEFDAPDLVFPSVSAGARAVTGLIIYKHVTDDTDSIPLAFYDFSAAPFNGNGGNIGINWDAEGLWHIT